MDYTVVTFWSEMVIAIWNYFVAEEALHRKLQSKKISNICGRDDKMIICGRDENRQKI